MKADKEYSQAIAQAQENYTDLKKRGADAVGGNVLEFMGSILTSGEIATNERASLSK